MTRKQHVEEALRLLRRSARRTEKIRAYDLDIIVPNSELLEVIKVAEDAMQQLHRAVLPDAGPRQPRGHQRAIPGDDRLD